MDRVRRPDDCGRLRAAAGHCASRARLVAAALVAAVPYRTAGRGCGGDAAMSASAATALSVARLSIRFGGLAAIDDMSFAVREGEVLSLIGPNGAGKTTAFNAITGYLRPAAGEVVYRGRRLTGRKPHQIAELGLVRTFQKTSVFGGRTALDNVLI